MNVLDQLYRLQDRIRFVQTREKERDTIPSDLVEVDKAYQEKVETIGGLRTRLQEAERECRRAEADLSDLREKHKKYQSQLRNVQSSREYGAVLNEIDGVDRLIRTTEDRVLALEEEMEQARKDLSQRQENLPGETEEHEDKLKGWRVTQREIDAELVSAKEEIARLEAEIAPKERAEFHRLLEKKGGVAIARVSGGSCSACHVKIRPAALQILKAGREATYCDSCKRILYYDHSGS
ncbi:MAG: zinc ribbon domain-containing protein [Thermoanaerobaculia bacterium]